jgi:predicted ferric reductase
MRSALRGAALGLVVLAVLGAVGSRAGWVAFELPRPAGTGAWLVARATGFTAFAALALDVICGLVVSTRAADRWIARGALIELHGWLSPIALVLVLGHAAVLLGDRYLRLDLLDVAVPFVAGYRRIAVGLGVIAGYLALAVHASFGLRKRLGARTWRRLHALSFVAFVAAAVHALAAGSDLARGWALALYGGPLAIVGALIVHRVVQRTRQRTGPGAGPPATLTA